MPNLVRSGVVSLGDSLVTGHGHSLSSTHGMDQLLVVGVAPLANVTVASALSPGSLLFPFSDSGFASLSSASFHFSSLSLSLPSPGPSSSWPSSSLSSAPPLSSSLPPTPSFPPSSAASSSVPPCPSSSLLPPPGFPPRVSSTSSAPLSSSSFPLHPPPPSVSFSLPTVSSSSSGVPSSVSPVPPFSSASSASSFLDFAVYQASVLGVSGGYQALARWYLGSGGSDFLPYLSAFYPHLSADASRDFSSGSPIFLSALRSLASSPRLPSAAAPSPPPEFAPPVSSVAPPPLPLHIPSSFGLQPQGSPFYPASGMGASFGGGFFRSSWVPFCSALFLSLCVFIFCAFSASGSTFFCFPFLWGSLGLRAPTPVAFAAPAVPVAAPDPSSPLFRPFAVSEPASVFLTSASAPVVSSAPLGSASASLCFASAPGPSSGVPPRFAAPPGASAPPPSAFAFAPEDPFDPGFPDLVAPSVLESVRAEVCRVYQYLVDLFLQSGGSLQAPPPPRARFEEFFSSASALQEPVYLLV